MSVKLMTKVYEAHFHDIKFIHKGKRKTQEKYTKNIRVLNSNLKSVCLALADHANDEGEGAYPSVETLESKTELSRVTVIACLTAMKQENIISRESNFSKWGTINYTINKEKLVDMNSWERQKREKPASKATLPGKAALLLEVKPLNYDGKAALPEPSLNHPLNQLGANAPDPLEGFLAFERLKHEHAAQLGLSPEVLDAIESYPADCQHGARLMFQRHKLTPPDKPRSGKGGDYADWINGIRELSNLCAKYHVDLEDGFNEFWKIYNPSPFTFDRPGAMTKTMRFALARHALREGANESTPEPEPERHPVPRPASVSKPTIGKPSLRPRVS